MLRGLTLRRHVSGVILLAHLAGMLPGVGAIPDISVAEDGPDIQFPVPVTVDSKCD